MIILCRKCDDMAITAIQPQIEQRKFSYVPTASIGALAGFAARHIMPTKEELTSLADTFESSIKNTSKLNSRSVAKYAAVGALIATAATAVINKIVSKPEPKEDVQYTNMGILTDASPFACEVYWYEGKQ